MKLIKDKAFIRRLLWLSLPIALQNLVTSILNIFDQLMVGWLPSNTDNCLSAVLLANQIVFIFQIVVFAASNTSNIFVAQYTENANRSAIPNRIGFLLLMTGGVTALATLLCALAPSTVIGIFSPQEGYRYLAEDFLRVVAWSFIPMGFSICLNFSMRAIKRMKVGLVANVVGVVCNIVFNYLFMFGGLGIEPMGFMGAAYGTILSRTVELVVTVAGLIIGKYPLFSRLRDMFVFERRFVARYFKMFFPILCNELFWVLSSTVYLYVYDKLPDSEVVLAAMNIAQSVDKIVSVAMIGIGSAAGIVIGNAIGEGDMPKVRSWANSCITFSIISGILIGVLTLLLSFVAPSFFTNVSLEAQEVAKRLLWLFSLTAVFRTLCFMQVIGILRAGGDTTYCMVWETLAIWLVSVPLVILGGHLGWNIYILYTLGSICEVIKCIIFGVRVKGSRWLKFISSTR